MDGRRGSPSRPVSAVAGKKARSESIVGMVCHSMVEDSHYEIMLYLVDLDDVAVAEKEEDHTFVKPAVRFHFPLRETIYDICVLKWTVFIFGGYYPRGPYGNLPKKEKYAKKYELLHKVSPNEDLQVKEEELVQIPTMRYAKGYPQAIPTPDGRGILVFSTQFRLKKSHRAFELYNPEENSWKSLPELPPSFHRCPFIRFRPDCDSESEPDSGSENGDGDESDGDELDGDESVDEPLDEEWDLYMDPSKRYCPCFLKVTSYSFIDASHFYLEIKCEDFRHFEVRNFALDLEEGNWVDLGSGLIPNEDYFVAAAAKSKVEFAITSKMACVIGHGGFLSGDAYAFKHDLNLSAFSPSLADELIFWRPSIVPLHPLLQGEGEEEVCNTCILQLEYEIFADEGRILIDVCRTKLNKCHTEVSKCLRLRIELPDLIDDFHLISV